MADMLNPELLEDYLNISDWKPPETDGDEREVCSCTRCGDREAAVSICVPCLLEVAAKITAENTAVSTPTAVRLEPPTPRKKRRMMGFLEWSAVILLSLGVLFSGSILANALR